MKNKTDLRPLKTVNLDDAIRSWESLYGIDHADLDRPANVRRSRIQESRFLSLLASEVDDVLHY